MMVPARPKIYHIVHVDRLASIVNDRYLWCDAEIANRSLPGTIIGMNRIKQRRLNELSLNTHPELHVGDCVPFYFCPRSVMLYLIFMGNDPDLTFRGGQESIIHLEADLYASVAWAKQTNKRWAFSLSNAGAYYFEDRNDLTQLDEVNWPAIQTNKWSGSGIPQSIREGKQAEFLMEHCFPWKLIERIGVYSSSIYQQAMDILAIASHKPKIEILQTWYY